LPSKQHRPGESTENASRWCRKIRRSPQPLVRATGLPAAIAASCGCAIACITQMAGRPGYFGFLCSGGVTTLPPLSSHAFFDATVIHALPLRSFSPRKARSAPPHAPLPLHSLMPAHLTPLALSLPCPGGAAAAPPAKRDEPTGARAAPPSDWFFIDRLHPP